MEGGLYGQIYESPESLLLLLINQISLAIILVLLIVMIIWLLIDAQAIFKLFESLDLLEASHSFRTAISKAQVLICIFLKRKSQKKINDKKIVINSVNPQAPVARKVADEVVYRRFGREGVEFFKIGPHWPPIRFLMRVFWEIPI